MCTKINHEHIESRLVQRYRMMRIAIHAAVLPVAHDNGSNRRFVWNPPANQIFVIPAGKLNFLKSQPVVAWWVRWIRFATTQQHGRAQVRAANPKNAKNDQDQQCKQEYLESTHDLPSRIVTEINLSPGGGFGKRN